MAIPMESKLEVVPSKSSTQSNFFFSEQPKVVPAADFVDESLGAKHDGQSIGAIVSDLAWKTNEKTLGPIELIPAFDDSKELAPIRRSLQKTGSLDCNEYHRLRPVQQRWIDVTERLGRCDVYGLNKDFLVANPLKFEKSSCTTIAIEMTEISYCRKEISIMCMEQLIRVLNYAHDHGGKRIIIINQTSFNTEQFLVQMKAQLQGSEIERTWSRLMLLLSETEDSIFKDVPISPTTQQPTFTSGQTAQANMT